MKKVYIVGDKHCGDESFSAYTYSVFSKKKDALKACCDDIEKVVGMKVYDNFEEWDKDWNK